MVGFESSEVPKMSSLGVAAGLRTEEADDNCPALGTAVCLSLGAYSSQSLGDF